MKPGLEPAVAEGRTQTNGRGFPTSALAIASEREQFGNCEKAHQRHRVGRTGHVARSRGRASRVAGGRGEPDRLPCRGAASRQGRPGVRRGFRARAAARRVRRVRHARRRLPRRGLHLARALPDHRGDHGGARRRRGGPHREELHRRRPELPDGRRALRRGGHRGRRPCWSTTTWPCRTASTRPAAGAPARRSSSRRSPGRWPRAGRRCTRSSRWPRRSTPAAARSASALSSCTVPAAGKPTFDLGDDEIELGIGIHGEPGRTRSTDAHRPRDRRPGSRWTPSTRTCRSPGTSWSW